MQEQFYPGSNISQFSFQEEVIDLKNKTVIKYSLPHWFIPCFVVKNLKHLVSATFENLLLQFLIPSQVGALNTILDQIKCNYFPNNL